MAGEQAAQGPLIARIDAASRLPQDPAGGASLEPLLADWCNSEARAGLVDLIEQEPVRTLIAGVVAGSPYLKSEIVRNPDRLEAILRNSPEQRFADLTQKLGTRLAEVREMTEAMTALRVYKAEVALMTALADLGGIWGVMQVTRVLSEAADAALRGAVRFLFRQAAAKGDWLPEDPDEPEQGSGYIVLAVGKYGAFELNYSSDIDLIVFYERALARLKPGLEAPTFFVRLTRDLVRLIDERTAAGYVFRTDLRLRPDAGATQIALSTDAAAQYYESFGQNWERAALIKARACAGDIEAGEAFLAELAPFIWRRNLDYAAIADIHAMKRQIHAFRGFGAGIGVAGHNIKLGPGGIREIEFFVQTQQLIAGGRQRNLRTRRTLDTLATLVALAWIEKPVADEIIGAYLYLREIEHRLQMVADEQTHVVPDDPVRLEAFARFAGYASAAEFSEALRAVLVPVQGHYARLFESAPELTAAGANLVFAGETDDPDTVAALTRMGYARPSDVLAIVRGWHHGRYGAVRTARARELLTEVQPLLVQAFAETADPDRAITTFDRFLAALPAGVQLFSLLKANPPLMRLLADMMGTAPRLARILSRRRRLLDAVIDPRTFRALPTATELDEAIAAELKDAIDPQDVLDRARVIGSEQAFLIGVKVLSGAINAGEAGTAYAVLAERLIAAMVDDVEKEMERAHGRVPGGGAVVVAMGKLGGRELSASSDLDLIVVYDFDPSATQSDGEKPLAPSQYYARYTQRLIAHLSAPTAEGTLYEVDMRLRPSGQKGPVAAQLSTFREYQATEAWTWEHLALTRARVITGPPGLRSAVEAAIRDTLVRPRDRAVISKDVQDMRARIAADKGTDRIWDLKQVRGGLVDLEFIAQHLQLIHAAAHPEVLDQNTLAAYRKLAEAGVLSGADAERLTQATRLLHNLTQILRLCLEEPFDPATAPSGLKALLARAGDAPDFATLEGELAETLAGVATRFSELVQ
ncbi:bifunctional [glutamine synthetase] adenylyltransferase/[glutamine synthetase]-adenylyl-L-tyrosine phosphorylase [Hyphomicrobium sp.]|uniref:bifunctional [glutamine synthetase] adenylyltransferase/[glutamine synthetase]-adenylyl-L-tyrosine phosphorylase n=1 Tax=Hyphomicrobium sp. TaxID=82 RepID=UPI002C713AC1|nr:bifunctional [glutamine synthetase] adenylyltransferase/[glutamine synthetase]-adenylyl-L-tyrosine phosphorylase [Hyphomicrobium sp.]HRN89769.1 bifunctional [glutamine synthetase] adenylyltransferase/[glutamine synthetase]-adenylyl-L-tyrosine phosphorylase [Hyphomicrobium sp.]HRQ26268.1 bifunctional [glutamine synthetase] adenylyltransferase/[glutamine synthetase]-adenylyl-L-tyrosine phosphorylase [Hyphomicrobium sp.]